MPLLTGPAPHHQQGVFDVLESGQDGDQIEILEHEPQVLTAKRRGLRSGKASDIDLVHQQTPSSGVIRINT